MCWKSTKATFPRKAATELKAELDKTVESLREQSDWTRSQSGLLGAMATVGSTAIAFDHQLNQQLGVLEYHAESLDNLVGANPGIRENDRSHSSQHQELDSGSPRYTRYILSHYR